MNTLLNLADDAFFNKVPRPPGILLSSIFIALPPCHSHVSPVLCLPLVSLHGHPLPPCSKSPSHFYVKIFLLAYLLLPSNPPLLFSLSLPVQVNEPDKVSATLAKMAASSDPGIQVWE
jgi:hypothetical protein